MELKRRDFLKTGTVLGAGALTLPSTVYAKDNQFVKERVKPKTPFSTDPCAMVALTDQIECSRIGFGTGMRGSNRSSNLTRMDEKEAIELLQYAYDKGVRLFDMADLYGTHGVVTKALEGKPRDRYTLVSKLWYHGGGIPEKERPTPDVTVKRFLKECKTDYLDLVQIHCMMDDKWAERFAEHMGIMQRLKEEGLIRAHGISCHANSSLELAAKTPWVDVVHVRINHDGAKMDGEVNGVAEVVKQCHDAGIGVIGMKIIGEGTFADNVEKRKKSAEFVMKLGTVDAIVIGFEKKQHVDEIIENVQAALVKMRDDV